MPKRDPRRRCRVNVGMDAELRAALETIARGREGATASGLVFEILDQARPQILRCARAVAAAEAARETLARNQTAALNTLLTELEETERTVRAMRPNIFLPEQDIEMREIRRLVAKLRRDFESQGS